VEFHEWKNLFFEDDIPRDIDPPTRDFQTLVSFLGKTISQENTPFGTKIKFVSVVWSEIRQHAHPKVLRNE
jgi:hypothetical protein